MDFFSLFGHSKFKQTLMTLLLSGGQTTSSSFTMEPEVLKQKSIIRIKNQLTQML